MDVVVVGGGHAGCEAALASARRGLSTLLLTLDLDRLGKMPCNPSMGGPGKSQLVSETDALGGIQGFLADRCAIHARVLNRGRGPAVQALRVQEDRQAYEVWMKHFLESVPNLYLLQGEAVALKLEGDRVIGVETAMGEMIPCLACVLAPGTFFRGTIHIGSASWNGGRASEPASNALPHFLEENMGVSFVRFKTGTPPRIDSASVDLDSMEVQLPEAEDLRFSLLKADRLFAMDRACWRVRTTQETHSVIMDNIKGSPLYGEGPSISGKGPRYCPSIETKVLEHPSRESHILFLEPEGAETSELYLSGFSTSMPHNVQLEMVRTLNGFSHALISRPGYAVEYDVIGTGQLKSNLSLNSFENLFVAGQINGSSGYEEAASQGIIAGMNAALHTLGEKPFIPSPLLSYCGSLINLMVESRVTEPVRMFTSLVQNRLSVRSDNADFRLGDEARSRGFLDDQRREIQCSRRRSLDELRSSLRTFKILPSKLNSYSGDKRAAEPRSLWELLRVQGVSWLEIRDKFPELSHGIDQSVWSTIAVEALYEPFIAVQQERCGFETSVHLLPYPGWRDIAAIPDLPKAAVALIGQACPESYSELGKLLGESSASMIHILKRLGRKQSDR
ncbi:MAG: tRNA uridine-5-carboxymethylaminomethyl(34) synthesis enzyme MnmG [Candidatus Wallbacteria bacterium HGW-Wallbacteria-1]|jgi:tRNA uridine 5-carboxymethylaminomethyl modification enzyme|uniref:tRNA uridine 5-carboxymethylaminomethyl modification enzyme MnmG n=1 Tax=Candidatus Wallbacteria bacterium HGW-Wallbacteria-1 TaxID=2013854 RepID=A0A2N1PUP2_9BACT|nr:MAG: tRNA uridine-5-carboxymethylaminomethyl(34) synthesis enzyme MnmG [Candidatus Wallbacteria bacterium HGW-Wallbacteria-1]